MLVALHNIIAGFLRRTWLVALVTVVVCAAFAARAVAALSDAALTTGSAAPPTVTAPTPARAAPPRRLPPNGDAFVTRNIFCSSCAPVAPGPAASGYQGEPAVLIATSIGAEPRATLRVTSTEVQGSWGLGEEIPGVGRIDDIHPTSIEVADAAGHSKLISLLDTAAPGGTGPTGPSGGGPVAKSPFEGRFKKINDTTFEVDRSLIRELVQNAAKPGMGGAVPVVVDGDVRGIRLVGIGSSSPGSALELRSGDLINSIDGVPLKNAQQVIDLFAKLDSVSSVELGGTRGKTPLQRTLNLR